MKIELQIIEKAINIIKEQCNIILKVAKYIKIHTGNNYGIK